MIPKRPGAWVLSAFVFLDTTGVTYESANKRRNHAGMVPADGRLIKFGARADE